MPRKYRKPLGIKPNCNYPTRNFEMAVKEVKNKILSVRAAAEKWNVPKSTLHNHVKEIKCTNTYGGQTVLTPDEEKMVSEGIMTAAQWNFPLSIRDIKLIVKSYLDRSGKNIKNFNMNLPGDDWAKNFLGRHQELTVRLAQNMKRARAVSVQVQVDVINSYFDELYQAIENVPPENVINYDETNFSDDPGKIKVITKRGSKHCDRVMDTSKTNISVMVAVAASGTLLPAYIVYKALHLYPTWIENGPPGAVYNRSKNGWFDQFTFEDWFHKIALPYFSKRSGKKILIGDNLSSHISVEVINKCKEHDISFILLPPNATHLCQPLDVAYFRPLKESWRSVLRNWKMEHRGVFQKSDFPNLLYQTFKKVELNSAKNIKSGFAACGILPPDRERVLKKLADYTPTQNNTEKWTNSFIDFFKENIVSSAKNKKARGKRLNIVPGRSVTFCDNRVEHSESDEELWQEENSNDDYDQNNEQSQSRCDIGQYNETEPLPIINNETEFECNQFILVQFQSTKRNLNFIGNIELVEGNSMEVNFLRKKQSEKMGIYFVYPDVHDKALVLKEEVLRLLKKPTNLRRNRFVFGEKLDYNGIG